MMSYWPRCVLTPWERKFMPKYAEPNDNRRGPLRRMYPGVLRLDAEERLPVDNLNIARRTRVFALSFAGDIEHFRVRVFDSTGEQYTADTVYVPHLIPGYANSQPGVINGLGPQPVSPGFNDVWVINPNIVLAPNQTLTIAGFETEPRGFAQEEQNDYQIDFTWHVWEFPGMPGSPL
jgi:hypothetical protein